METPDTDPNQLGVSKLLSRGPQREEWRCFADRHICKAVIDKEGEFYTSPICLGLSHTDTSKQSSLDHCISQICV